jgi:hypothetical protein
VRENVIIAYRGGSYELGQWPQGYGIWRAGTPQSEPLEWWPPTPEGWSAAWYRFAAIETPGTISAAPPESAQPAAGQPSAGSPTAPGGAGLAAGPDGAGFAAGPGGPGGAGFAGGPAGAGFAGGPAGAGFAGGPGFAAGPAGPAGPSAAGGPGYAGGPAFAAGSVGRPAVSVAAEAPPIGRGRALVAAGLLALGIVCGIAGLFPSYVSGASLASDATDLVPHLIYLAAWAAAAVLIFRGGALARTGALLGLGTGVVTFGLFLADAGTPIAGGASLLGAGLVLGIIGWFFCTAGAAAALGRGAAGFPRRAFGREIAIVALLVAAAVGAAISFAPSWDSYLLRVATGASEKVTAGYAFANPGPVIAGDVVVMVALVAVVVVAALWRPARLGWALAAGAVIPMVAQAISALIQAGQPVSPASFGYSPAVARAAGLTISQGLTGWFWAYCAFLLALIIGCGWLAVSREQTALRPAGLGRAAYPGSVPFGGAGPTAFPGAAPAAHPSAAPAAQPSAAPAPHPGTAAQPSAAPMAYPSAGPAAQPGYPAPDGTAPSGGDTTSGPDSSGYTGWVPPGTAGTPPAYGPSTDNSA